MHFTIEAQTLQKWQWHIRQSIQRLFHVETNRNITQRRNWNIVRKMRNGNELISIVHANCCTNTCRFPYCSDAFYSINMYYMHVTSFFLCIIWVSTKCILYIFYNGKLYIDTFKSIDNSENVLTNWWRQYRQSASIHIYISTISQSAE